MPDDADAMNVEPSGPVALTRSFASRGRSAASRQSPALRRLLPSPSSRRVAAPTASAMRWKAAWSELSILPCRRRRALRRGQGKRLWQRRRRGGSSQVSGHESRPPVLTHQNRDGTESDAAAVERSEQWLKTDAMFYGMASSGIRFSGGECMSPSTWAAGIWCRLLESRL